MTVALILAQKGSQVFTASTRQTLEDVANELTSRGVGALVVLDDADVVVGVIGEREIVHAIATRGAAALSERVALHMNKNRRFVTEDESLEDTARTMTVERCRHLPVLRDGRLAGVVSIGDVVKWRIEMIEAEREALHHYIATA